MFLNMLAMKSASPRPGTHPCTTQQHPDTEQDAQQCVWNTCAAHVLRQAMGKDVAGSLFDAHRELPHESSTHVNEDNSSLAMHPDQPSCNIWLPLHHNAKLNGFILPLGLTYSRCCQLVGYPSRGALTQAWGLQALSSGDADVHAYYSKFNPSWCQAPCRKFHMVLSE